MWFQRTRFWQEWKYKQNFVLTCSLHVLLQNNRLCTLIQRRCDFTKENVADFEAVCLGTILQTRFDSNKRERTQARQECQRSQRTHLHLLVPHAFLGTRFHCVHCEIARHFLEFAEKKAKQQKPPNTIFDSDNLQVSLATFGTYVMISEDHYLSPDKAFVTMSYINMFNFLLSILPYGVFFAGQVRYFLLWDDNFSADVILHSVFSPTVSHQQAIVSFERIKRFLDLEEIKEGTVQQDSTLSGSGSFACPWEQPETQITLKRRVFLFQVLYWCTKPRATGKRMENQSWRS